MVFIIKSVLQKHITFLRAYFTKILKYSEKDRHPSFSQKQQHCMRELLSISVHC